MYTHIQSMYIHTHTRTHKITEKKIKNEIANIKLSILFTTCYSTIET
jgi:transposase